MRYVVSLVSLCVLFCTTGWGAVYDCFMFHNELDILEIRLEELYNYVDKFVLVESAQAHRLGNSKPYYFELNQERFTKYRDKIIHIKLDKQLVTDDGWVRENWHRNQIMLGLAECQPEDLILISDVDEIIPGHMIPTLYELTKKKRLLGCMQRMYRFFLNRSAPESEYWWSGTGVLRFKHLQKMSPQEVRNRVRNNQVEMVFTGWHFSSMGGYEKIQEKYFSIVEGYDRYLSYADWRAYVKTHPLVPIDHTYPQYIQDHVDELRACDLIDGEK